MEWSWRGTSLLVWLALAASVVFAGGAGAADEVGSARGAGSTVSKPSAVDKGAKRKGAAPETVAPCLIKGESSSSSRRGVSCPRIPGRIAPWSLRVGRGSSFSPGEEDSAFRLMGESGNELDITTGVVTNPYVTPFY